MQAVCRRLGNQYTKQSTAPISCFKSIYLLPDQCYGAENPRFASSLATKGVGHLVRKGTGGRSSVSGIVATVFGATGFLGRYLVQQLAKMGSQVLVPFRGSEDCHRHLKLMGDLGQVSSNFLLAICDTYVHDCLMHKMSSNRKGVRDQKFQFEEVNHHMAEQLALIAKEHGGIMRYIQVSCLGASPSSPSRMLRAKAAGEEAVLRELPEATIMRPAAMIGTEDRVLNPWAHFAKKYSFLPLIGDGSTKIQPVYVVDVASAIVAALKDDGSSMGKVYELGGPEIYTLHQLAELMYDMIREWPHYVKVPFPIAKAIATPREVLLKKVPQCLPLPYSTWTKLKHFPRIHWCLKMSDFKERPTMKNFSNPKQKYPFGLPEYLNHLMPPQTTHGPFENVRLAGRNVGASMIMGDGGSSESPGSCSINIYINNDIQGINNSVLIGSEVKMGDP
ncbi:UNVERIFIED_CONTAM: NADH dehydrogenase [ubiquinone] 1 alpha subcomplex subunit, mitochondrial [Sesamum latifolium]|uniref:NADH dehydrogenase [ubiquinone] 1 alpha subcomplex subunit, mitochondrial n=1 Tax=Sesamum latifolium TaxID=2727402 RepID=A0AAW2Y0G6_9LAMI